MAKGRRAPKAGDPGHLFDGQVAGFKQLTRFLDPHLREPIGRRTPGHLREAPRQRTFTHGGRPSHPRNRPWLGERRSHLIEERGQPAPRAKRHGPFDELRLPSTAVGWDDQSAGDSIGDFSAALASNDVKQQIDPSRAPRGREKLLLLDIKNGRVDPQRRIGLLQFIRIAPQWVATRWPSRSPVSANRKAPKQMEARLAPHP